MALGSVDPYLRRRYDRREYNCLHFARDVWQEATGEDVTEKLAGLLDPASRHPTRGHFRSFKRINTPQDPCFVLMRRPRLEAHVGVYIRGRVLHIQAAGAEFQLLEVVTRDFTETRFYQ